MFFFFSFSLPFIGAWILKEGDPISEFFPLQIGSTATLPFPQVFILSIICDRALIRERFR